jgi:hypothetical protein
MLPEAPFLKRTLVEKNVRNVDATEKINALALVDLPPFSNFRVVLNNIHSVISF